MSNTLQRIKNNLVICLLCFMALGSKAQNMTLEWSKVVGGDNDGIAYYQTMKTDEDGNIYLAGRNIGIVDLDPSEDTQYTGTVGQDCFIQKLDSNGNLLWANTFNNFPESNDITNIELDENNNIYIIGYIVGIEDVNPGNGTFEIGETGKQSMFVEKLDSNGNFLWAKTIDSSGSNGSAIALDSSGNIYITGKFHGETNFNPDGEAFVVDSDASSIYSGQGDLFIQKMDQNGTFIWVKTIEDINEIATITIDSFNDIYLSGIFNETVDFDPNSEVFELTSNGESDAFIQKLDTDGNLIWAKAVGGSQADFSLDITTDAEGNVYTTGYFHGTINFDPSTDLFELTAQERDIYIQKRNSTGDLLWAKSMGGSALDIGQGLYVNNSQEIYLTGYFSETADLDPSSTVYELTSQGSADIFIEKLDNNGNMLWVTSFGGDGFDYGDEISIDDTGKLYLSGKFSNSIDFDPEQNGNEWDTGETDASYILKLDLTNSNVGTVENQFSIKPLLYPNPATENFTIDLQQIYQQSTVTIRDITGQIIQKLNAENTDKIHINLNQQKGIYFLSISAEEQQVVVKLIKN